MASPEFTRWARDRPERGRVTRPGNFLAPSVSVPRSRAGADTDGGQEVTIVIGGELDATAAPLLADLRDWILEEKPAQLVFDMTGVQFIDCAAARLIISTGQCLPGSGHPVIRPSPVVRRLLEITGLDAYCRLEAGRVQATAAS